MKEIFRPDPVKIGRQIEEINSKRQIINLPNGYRTHENVNSFQVVFESVGCQKGNCLECDYGHSENNLNPSQVEESFDLAMNEISGRPKALVVDVFGSILDEKEFPKKNLDVLLDKIKKTDFKAVLFETHHTTINDEILEKLKNELSDREILIEMGLETSNEKNRWECLHKKINNQDFIDVVNKIHNYGMGVTANLLVGLPFLTTEEQVNDCLESIKFCNQNNIEEMVLFPLNPKPGTLLWKYYKEGNYELVSQWMNIEILSRLDEETINKIFFAWYGNKQIKYAGEKSIEPKSCDVCRPTFMDFYENFLGSKEIGYRKNLVDNLISSCSCDCYDNLQKEINSKLFD